jgi:hypothetical protein
MPEYIGQDDDNDTSTHLTEGDFKRMERERQREEVDKAAKDWDPEREAHEQQRESHKTVICFNSACADYRVARTDGRACACRRTAIQGAGTHV